MFNFKNHAKKYMQKNVENNICKKSMQKKVGGVVFLQKLL